jgi:glucosamine-phosphate N-acetyltransferase
MEIRELNLTDDFIAYTKLLEQLTTTNPDAITNDAYLTHLKQIQSNPLHKIYVAVDSDKIIGSATLLIEPKIIHELSYVGHIEDVVVNQNCRSSGVGRSLIEHLVKIAKNHNCYKIILTCADKNIGFYEKFGFKARDNNMAYYLEN